MISLSSTTLVQLQSQSKLLGQLLSSRLLNVCVHDFDLTAINNIGRERKRARRKKLCPVEVFQLFLSETVVLFYCPQASGRKRIDIKGRKQSLLLQSTSGFMNLPMASHSFACKASTTGTLILTEADAASSESACSRRTEAAIEPAPSAKKQCLSSMLSLLSFCACIFAIMVQKT